MPLVTIDFHNTLFQCDDWFHLEVEDLPAAFLRWRADQRGEPFDHGLARAANQRYRELRQLVMSTGRECDAVASMHHVLQDVEIPAGDDVATGVELVMSRTVESARPLPGAIELVQTLSDSGVSLAVVSSAAYHPFLEWCLARFGVRDAFDAVVTSASCGIYKSDPAIYRFTLDLTGSNPEESVHIGDSHRFDVASANKVGMRTILLSDTHDDELAPAPDAIITRLGDAKPHLDRLLPGRTSI